MAQALPSTGYRRRAGDLTSLLDPALAGPLVRRGLRSALTRVDPRWAEYLRLARQVPYIARSVVPTAAASATGAALAEVVPTVELGSAGIDLREERQLALLESWTRHTDLYRDLRADPGINVAGDDSAIVNQWFQTPDAEVYASIICDLQPRDIVEVGAGFSTIVARAAIRHAGLSTRLIAIDPEPRTAIAAAADVVVRCPFEEVGWDSPPFSELTERTVIFIDSSHVARAGGEVPLLFNRVIPCLPTGTAVHVDDIFIPWDYPISYQRRLYNEQYVLQALLCHSERFSTLFGAHFMVRRHGERMRAVMGPAVGAEPDFFGSSYWFTA